jgi:hypothetical protein
MIVAVPARACQMSSLRRRRLHAFGVGKYNGEMEMHDA